ncbi:hypothetical protein [Janthinobacterium sp. LB2P70]|uniref:hypothetical protein n=1 Tax=Janthinobacterium sp. LB2P70 TaxID=3424197 RepID=UPI003F27C5FB
METTCLASSELNPPFWKSAELSFTAAAAYRMAGSAAPAILQAIDARIAGRPLDADAERQAPQQLK